MILFFNIPKPLRDRIWYYARFYTAYDRLAKFLVLKAKPAMHTYTVAGFPSGCSVTFSITPIKIMTIEYNCDPIYQPSTFVTINIYDSSVIHFLLYNEDDTDVTFRGINYTRWNRSGIYHDGLWNRIQNNVVQVNDNKKYYDRHTVVVDFDPYRNIQEYCLKEYMNNKLSVVRREYTENKNNKRKYDRFMDTNIKITNF